MGETGYIPEQRRVMILKLLEEKGSVGIRELQELFDTSHMTVHRDLDVLAKTGEVKKVRGGAVPGPKTNAAGSLVVAPRCTLCGMRVTQRMAVILTRRDKSQLHACCPHCGILLLEDDSDLDSALARDFLYGRMTSLFEATFLIDSDIRPCCVPSTLCFATESEALAFQKGFGGQVFDLDSAKERLLHPPARKELAPA